MLRTRTRPWLYAAALLAVACDPASGVGDQSEDINLPLLVPILPEPEPDGPQCWDCDDDDQECLDEQPYNMCLVQCEDSGDAWYDLGALADGTCEAAAEAFCELHDLGDAETACWGGY